MPAPSWHQVEFTGHQSAYLKEQFNRYKDLPGDHVIPAAHLDGLWEIKGSSGVLQSGGTAAVGLYHPNQYTVEASSSSTLYERTTVPHEVGHHVHLSKLNNRAVGEWNRISQGGSTAKVSSYARTNTGEHFAEAYARYYGGPTDRANLEKLEPKAHAFMSKLSGKLLPPREFASLLDTNARYMGTPKKKSIEHEIELAGCSN